MTVRSVLWTGAAAASLVAVPVLGVPVLGVPVAAAAPTGRTPPASGQRAARACQRVPQRIDRLQTVQTRLHADARTRGSLAFLSARIDAAKAGGKNDLARLLSDRLAIRKDIDALLPDLLAKLRDAHQACAPRATASLPPGSS